MSAQKPHVIIVAGAGPAGLAAAGSLAEAGHEVIILNRDIKFGGLAEYGIFPSKLKLRGGLKKQYWELLERPNVHYFGNVSIGNGKDLTVDEVRELGASAVVFAIGAQGTKAIGVEGDSAKGVFHAKDVVYHYCRLPGFGDRPFDMGKHVAVIGAGDVMVDIAHWLTRYKKVDRVTAIVRRGPAERKYNPKEIRAVCANMDLDGIKAEFARIKDRLIAVGQNPDEIYKGLVDEFTKCEPKVSETKMGFRFLASPKRILVDGNNRVRALEMEDNKLETKGEDTAAVGLRQYYEFPCDSVVFAVGDKVDETVGLPYKGGVFVTNPNKTGNDPDDALFQAYDEATGRVVEGVFLAGWARKASEGLVGVAKRDGDWCAEVVSRYLAGKPAGAEPKVVLDKLLATLKQKKSRPVTVKELRILEEAEKVHKGTTDAIGEFKYVTNQEMIALIERQKV
ncbi:FAD-dependent oxidoreductase [Nitrospira moscoviensis]|uniref:Putative Ferredoxin-NADP(+) reductase n=1 Tax=Nitrospira moscoviensis TaxID=42253 RepID=A0A0K2GCC5_NITMO|nr:FAD-dependent oxidoreductase [Nitrospira moscoviensis]ALA58504.1 putative Ferredoxin-NADP(+) reductase [Nitrospira moscoviensis]